MAAKALVDPSTRRLSEVARHLVVPSGIVDTLWFEVEERCREFGDEFDTWQDGLGQIVLGVREDGSFAATVGGITLSIPRQVAKTFIVMRIVVALCTLFPNLTVIWTAHRLRTTTYTFQNFKSMVLRPTVRGYLRSGMNDGTAIRDANGEQAIPFKNGSVILFGAREQGFGRGFDRVDIEVFDEAQILTLKALEDMVAATNQSQFEFGALLFYMGTPPRPTDQGDVFKERRREALAFKAGAPDFTAPAVGEDSLYVECSADHDADPEDREQWAKANPSYPHRTPLRSLLRLRKNLPGTESWAREALGIWDADDTQEGPISPARWAQLIDGDSMATDETLTLALDAPLDRKSATFSVYGKRSDGLRHIAIRYGLPNSKKNETVADVARIAKMLCDGHKVSLHMPPNSPARAWKDDLAAAGVEVIEIKPAAFTEAQAMIEQAVTEGAIRHRGQPEMNVAVKGLAARVSGDTDPWSRRTSGANVAPLFAAAAAAAADTGGVATESAAVDISDYLDD